MSNDDQAIRTLVQTWLDASKAGDTQAVLSLMTDDAIFMVAGQEPFGRDAFANVSARQQGLRIEGTSDIHELKVLGDWAYLRSHMDMRITPAGGATIHRTGWTLTILQKGADGRWRLSRDANLLTVQET